MTATKTNDPLRRQYEALIRARAAELADDRLTFERDVLARLDRLDLALRDLINLLRGAGVVAVDADGEQYDIL